MLRDLKYFPRGEVKEMAWLLQQDEELQGILSDALMRSEQHRENYLRYILQLDPRTSSLYSFTIIIISSVRSSSVYHVLLEGSSSHFFRFFKFFRF